MSNLCKQGMENIGFSSHVCYDFSSVLGPHRLHSRGLGHPSVAFWPLWVPRLIPGSHFVNLCQTLPAFGLLVARAEEGTPKSLNCVPLGHPFQFFFDEKVNARRACVYLALFL